MDKGGVAPLFVVGLALIGAFSLGKWIWQAIPKSFEAAFDAANVWLTTPRLSVLDFLGSVIFFGVMFILILGYGVVGPRP